MDRLFAGGTVNAAQSGQGAAPALFLFHSLLSDRASFDAVVPELSPSFRLIVPELPGFGASKAVSGGLAEVADRMADAVKDAADGGEAIVLGNGYGGFVALQMAIRHPGIASRLILADCGAAFSEEGRQAFRNMAAASRAKGLPAITDVAMRRLFAPEFQESHPDLMRDRREAFLRSDPEVIQAACLALAGLDLRPELRQGWGARAGAGRRTRRGDAAADVARIGGAIAERAAEGHRRLRPCPAAAIPRHVPGGDRRLSAATVGGEMKLTDLRGRLRQRLDLRNIT